MSGLAGTAGCVGINIPAASSYPTRVVACHEMVDLPGGMFVMGSFSFSDATPRWVYLDSYSVATTATSKSQYREATGRMWVRYDPMNHPMWSTSYKDALYYLAKRGCGLTLPTEAQWENAARGPALNMREVMENEVGRFTPGDFVDFARGRFENFVLGPLEQVFTNPGENELFRRLIEKGMPFYGWRVYGTPSGRLTHDEAWYEQEGMAPVDWGPPNAYGLKGMTGGIWEWVKDWYREIVNMSDVWNPTGPDAADYRVLRGASWANYARGRLRAAYRYNLSEVMGEMADYGDPSIYRGMSCGFRVAAPQDL